MTDISGRTVYTLIHKGKKLHTYWMLDDGNIYNSRTQKVIKTSTSGTSGASRYPKVSLWIEGKARTVAIHRLVCETFHPLPETYPGIPVKDWKKTPDSVKKELMKNMQVNHINGDRMNYHPSNLEWTTATQNLEHYHKVIRTKSKD